MISSPGILKANILIVDDQEVNVLVLERMLCGAIDVKCKGQMHTWFLNRRNRYPLSNQSIITTT